MSAVLEAIIDILELGVGVGTTLYSSSKQSELIEAGEESERRMYEGQMAESRAARKAQEKLSRQQLRENKRQFDLSYGLKEEELGLAKEKIARDSFQNRMSYLTSILDKNESLKTLYTNRLSGLRR